MKARCLKSGGSNGADLLETLGELFLAQFGMEFFSRSFSISKRAM
jgi:hypothetical protein